MPARSRLACRFFHPSRENNVGGSALTNEVSVGSLGGENLVQKIIEVGRHPAVGGFGFSLHLPDDRHLWRHPATVGSWCSWHEAFAKSWTETIKQKKLG
jgi:hypothetical protein